MKAIIDLHQDLLFYLSRPDLCPDRQQTSFEQLKSSNIKVLITSTFVVPPEHNYYDPIANTLIEQDLIAYNDYVAAHPEFKIIRTSQDLDYVLQTDGLYGLILHVEGMNVFDASTDWQLLDKWYDLGLRSIGPVWNLTNKFGGGTTEAGGLTDLGKELIAWCERKRVIFDFAHMNAATFQDAKQIVTKPIFVSHGNARAICETIRNYTDEQIKLIAASGGVMGLFFSKTFISRTSDPVTLDDVVKHLDHIKQLVGIDHLAIGSDFGGILSGFAEGLDSVTALPNLREYLKLKNYSEPELDKIFFANAQRIIQSML